MFIEVKQFKVGGNSYYERKKIIQCMLATSIGTPWHPYE